MFHSNHVVDIQQALQALLPPETGYFVVSERSIQLIRDDLLNTPEPEHVVGVAIYQAETDDALGKLVTRLELKSPANKPPGSHFRQYLAKRDETLLAGINLVEIDYLHERRSPLAILPDYTRQEPRSYPYHILVSRPYPSLADGLTGIYGFRVDDPIPPIAIPLVGEDTVTLDLNAVYNHTYSSNLTYGLRLVDYAQQPAGFDAYSQDDQQRIEARMAIIAQQ